MKYRSNPFHPLPARYVQVVSMVLAFMVIAACIAAGVVRVQLSRMRAQLAPMIEAEFERMLGRDVRVGRVEIHGISTIVLHDLTVAGGESFDDGTALSVPETRAYINIFSFLTGDRSHPVGAISRVVLRQPSLVVTRSADGAWDFQDVVDRLAVQKGESGFRATIIANSGAMRYDDHLGFAGGPPLHEQLVKVNARVTPRGDRYAFTVRGEDQHGRLGGFAVAGHYAGGADEAKLDITANRVLVNAMTEYLPKKLPISFSDGTAAVHLTALFSTLPTPDAPRTMAATNVTAEVDLSGVALKLDEMATPLVATSGRLRLTHDIARYPEGSTLSLIGVRAEAYDIPVTINGDVREINLLDLSNLNPVYDLHVGMQTDDGARIARLFPKSDVTQTLKLNGPVSMQARVTGHQRALHIDGTANSRGFTMRDLRGSNMAFDFTLRPAAKPGTPSATMTARMADGYIGDTRVKNLRVQASTKTALQQMTNAPVITGTATTSHVGLPWFDAGTVVSEFTITREGVTLSDLTAHAFDGDIAGSAFMPFANEDGPPQFAVQASATYNNANMTKLATMAGIAGVRGRADGTIFLRVDPRQAMTLTTQFAGTDVTYNKYIATKLAMALSADAIAGDTTVSIDTATAHTDYGVFTVTNGSITREAEEDTLHLPLRGTAVNLARFSDKVTGAATMDGVLTGTIANPLLTARLHATDGSVLERPFATGAGDLTWTRETLTLANAELSRPGVSLRVLNDTLNLRGDFIGFKAQVKLHGIALADALAYIPADNPWPIDGATEGIVELAYTEHGMTATGSAAIPNATVHIPREDDTYPLKVDRLAMDFAYDKGRLQVKDLAATLGDSVIHATGDAFVGDGTPARVAMTFAGPETRLHEMPLDLFGIPVALAGKADVTGTLDGVLDGSGAEPLRVDVQANAPKLLAEGLPAGAGAVDLTYTYRPDDRQLMIHTGSVNHPAFTAKTSGRYDLTARRMTDVVVTMDRLDLALAQSALGSMPPISPQAFMARGLAMKISQPVRGTATLRITADGSFNTPNLAVHAQATALAYGERALPDLRAELASSIVNGRYGVRIRDFALARDDGHDTVALSGAIFPDGTLDLRYDIRDIELALLRDYIGNVPVEGAFSLSGAVSGPWTRPIIDADIAAERVRVAKTTVGPISGHLRLDGDALTVTESRVQLTPNGKAARVTGHLPVRWSGPLPAPAMDSTMALTIELPKQDLAALKLDLPGVRNVRGQVTAEVHVGGTLNAPKVAGGAVTLAQGSLRLPTANPGVPSQLNDLGLRVRIVSENGAMRLVAERATATVIAYDGKKATSGRVQLHGDVRLPMNGLLTPERWQWDLRAAAVGVPVPKDSVMLSQATGVLRLHGEGRSPLLQGVLFVDNVKLKEPPSGKNGTPQWGPFALNPRLSVMIHVGEKVRFSKSIITVDLQSTPFTRPRVTANGTPLSDATFAYTAEMLRPSTAQEKSGSWGVLTGSLNDPLLYARFEVDGKKLAFPMSLIGSVKNAKGHLTYNLRDGVHVSMGLDQLVTSANNTE